MYQQIIIVGNLGSDPEMRYMPDGTAVTNFSVATNRKWTDGQGNPQEEACWFRVSAWGRQAETTNQYLAKGSKVLVEGQLRPDPATGGPRIWTRSSDGTVRTSYEIQASTVRFLSGRDDDDGGYAPVGGGATAVAQEEDDIPF